MWSPEQTKYEAILLDFQNRFNNHERAKKLVNNWNRLILLDATDTGSMFGLVVKDQEMISVSQMDSYDEDDEELVHLQGEEEVLKNVFSGVYNPATALVDGALAVFSQDRDKVKLEALAMIIWRIG